jgi:phage-related protein
VAKFQREAPLGETVCVDGNAYRAVYTVRYADAIYVLHAFQKKSKKGIATPRAEMNLIEKRLKDLIKEKEERQ